MNITGSCHCGDIAFTLDWPETAADIVARLCDCSFCVKHGGAWTSNREARLTVSFRHPEAVSRYAFGTNTASFLVCALCGVVPVVLSEIASHTYAVVNVNTFENPAALSIRTQAAGFDQEELRARLARRQRNWIHDVTIAAGTHATTRP